jgi:hypothetical protein
MQQAHLLELTPSEPQPIILLPIQLVGDHFLLFFLEVPQPQRSMRQRPLAV